MDKQTKIAKLTEEILTDSLELMKKDITRAINSGALEIDEWDENSIPMIIPKIIAVRLLEKSAEGLKGKGTSFEKHIKKEVKNLSYFI